MQRLRQYLSICHLLLFGAGALTLSRKRRAAGLCLLVAGSGGLGAAWSEWSDDNGAWLRLVAAGRGRPSRAVRRCALEHAPLALAGGYLLWKG